MKIMKYLLLSLIVLSAANVNGQVRIGGNTDPHGSAILDLNATNDGSSIKGLALPRVNGTASVTNPIKGLFVYNLVDNMVYYYTGAAWETVSNSVTNSWSMEGNTPESGKFIGTTNTQPLIFKVYGDTAGIIRYASPYTTAIGYQALKKSTGNYNTAFG